MSYLFVVDRRSWLINAPPTIKRYDLIKETAKSYVVKIAYIGNKTFSKTGNDLRCFLDREEAVAWRAKLLAEKIEKVEAARARLYQAASLVFDDVIIPDGSYEVIPVDGPIEL